jgi:hypothetical protein
MNQSVPHPENPVHPVKNQTGPGNADRIYMMNMMDWVDPTPYRPTSPPILKILFILSKTKPVLNIQTGFT